MSNQRHVQLALNMMVCLSWNKEWHIHSLNTLKYSYIDMVSKTHFYMCVYVCVCVCVCPFNHF